MGKLRTTSARAAVASSAPAAPSTASEGGSGVPSGATGSGETSSDPASGPADNASVPVDGTVILDAELPSTSAAEGSLAAPVISMAGVALAGNILSASIPGTPGPDAEAGDTAELDPIGDVAGRTIMVRSVSDAGRRRAGISFGPKPQPVEVDGLTEGQLGALLADPQLIVSLDD